MGRKRQLDPFVSTFVDRHGKERFRFRRGRVSRYLPPHGTKEYRQAYADAMAGVPVIERTIPKSVGDMVARYYRSLEFIQAGEGWQATMRQSIEPFREKAGKVPVADFRPEHIERELADKTVKRVIERDDRKKVVGGTAAAQRLHEILNRLFRYAKGLGWIAENPVASVKAPKHKVKGFHPWTEQDIAAFRKHWPLGTKARLAMELMLWTGARRGDAHLMPHPLDGRFVKEAAKTGKELNLPVAPMLQRAIDAMPESELGKDTLIVTSFGKPFSRAGFGNKMREWCDAAKLPLCTAHGLRKALARRAAGRNVSQQGLKALGQWENDQEVKTYVADANKIRLAEDALAEVVAWEREMNIG